MRLPVEISARRLARPSAGRKSHFLISVAFAGALSACGTLSGGGEPALSAAPLVPANGPGSDYPVTVGDVYQIGSTTYRPVDTMNYDEVGYLTEDSGARGITGSHHTLPVPSYVEVTSLTTGRTILVRLERRGPMASNHLLALSPAALAQLDATAETPVRVRRVNAPEEQRSMLRGGQTAPARMDTPMSLVTVLRRRLPNTPMSEPAIAGAATPELASAAPSPAPEPAPAPAPAPVAVPVQSSPPALPPLAGATPAPVRVAPVATAAPVAAPTPTPAPTPSPASAAASDRFMVQAAAFSSEERARSAATALGGNVSRSGALFRVRTGPFPTRAAAEASLANVRRAGYSDARIFTGG